MIASYPSAKFAPGVIINQDCPSHLFLQASIAMAIFSHCLTCSLHALQQLDSLLISGADAAKPTAGIANVCC